LIYIYQFFKNEDTDKIRNIFKTSIDMVRNVFVCCVPNKGADITPMLCSFGNDLIKYDIISHIHTKKSLAWNSEYGDKMYNFI